MELSRRRLRNFLYETYTKARIDQLFNIIIEFPESQPALEDLKVRKILTNLSQAFYTVYLAGMPRKDRLTHALNDELEERFAYEVIALGREHDRHFDGVHRRDPIAPGFGRFRGDFGDRLRAGQEVSQDEGGHCEVHRAVAHR